MLCSILSFSEYISYNKAFKSFTLSFLISIIYSIFYPDLLNPILNKYFDAAEGSEANVRVKLPSTAKVPTATDGLIVGAGTVTSAFESSLPCP